MVTIFKWMLFGPQKIVVFLKMLGFPCKCLDATNYPNKENQHDFVVKPFSGTIPACRIPAQITDVAT